MAGTTTGDPLSSSPRTATLVTSRLPCQDFVLGLIRWCFPMDGDILIEVVAAVMESLGSTGHPNHGGQQQ